jgi:O-antigen/teichoic acid export membrane protein
MARLAPDRMNAPPPSGIGAASRSAVPAMGLFIGVKIAMGVLLVSLSAHRLAATGFSDFTQLMLGFSLLNLLAAGGTQSGIVRGVARAGGDRGLAGRTIAAAMRLWLVLGGAIILAVLLFRTPLAQFLTGRAGTPWLLPVAALLAVVAAFGQIQCAVLTGLGQAHRSLIAQSVGLLAGSLGAAALLFVGQYRAAILAYAAGPVLTILVATFSLRPYRLAWVSAPSGWRDCRELLGFSGAFLITASVTPLTLFVLRDDYRSAFGIVALGYWLAANRISDVNTQLIGVYLAQIFLPKASAVRGPLAAVTTRALLAVATMMVGTFGLFCLAPHRLVRAFLSPAFEPAIPLILLYLVGDVLRCLHSTALNLSLAERRLARYAATEIGSAAIMLVVTLELIRRGYALAPGIGYGLGVALAGIASLLVAAAPRLSPSSPARAAPSPAHRS